MGQDATLEKAYELIHEFRRGAFSNDIEITADQLNLLLLLSTDLGIDGTSIPIEQLALLIAEHDSTWNKRTQFVIHRIYELRAVGKDIEAATIREDFQRNCPSSWYRGIVDSL